MIDIKEDYYILIRNKIIDNEIYEKVKDYSKERHKLLSYYDIGKLLSEAGSKYGENVIKEYSEKLALDIGKKYKERSLRNMRQFYNMFCDAKWQTAFAKLTWSHFLAVLPLDNENEISFYLTNAIDNNLTVRELKEIIKTKTYYRLPESIRSKQETIKDIQLKDTIKNPIIFYSDTSEIKEHALQMLILENIPYFLDELGESFTFVRNEYRIKLSNSYNYIDLLLYNIKYKCYVVVELKVTELKKEHIGQIQTYMNYCDKHLKEDEQNSTLGIIICKKSNNELVVDYSSNENIIAREYILRVKERDT